MRLLDLFCGAGGCSMGYHRAGFEVVGVDKRPQKRYPFKFIQADALEYLAECGHCFDAIHASPPCQAYCALRHLAGGDHPDMVDSTRTALIATGKPYVIENVPGAPLRACLVLCGTMFGLRTDCGAELQRHRLFETNWWGELGILVPPCHHGAEAVCSEHGGKARDRRRTLTIAGHAFEVSGQDKYRKRTIMVAGATPRDPAAEKASSRRRVISVTGKTADNPATVNHGRRRTVTVTGSTAQQNAVRNTVRETFSVEQARIAMGIDWMTMKELSQAIPPAYTEFIGRALMEHLKQLALELNCGGGRV